MYILTIKTHFGVKVWRHTSEAEAVAHMRLWARHPTFLSAEVEALRPVVVVTGGRRR